MRHRLGKVVAVLVAGLAAISLLSVPASANTAYLEFIHIDTTSTPGNITVYNEDGDPVAVINVGSDGTGPTCSTDPTTSSPISVIVTHSTTSVRTITIVITNSCSAFVVGGVQWCAYMTGTITGTWTNGTSTTSSTYTSASVDPPVSGGITVVLRKNTSTTPNPPHNCHHTTTAFCTINVTGLAVNGIITTHNLPTLAVSDAATVVGGSGAGTVVVTGNATTCGLFIGANQGSTSINARVHVTHL
jgi:hypothetical protein